MRCGWFGLDAVLGVPAVDEVADHLFGEDVCDAAADLQVNELVDEGHLRGGDRVELLDEIVGVLHGVGSGFELAGRIAGPVDMRALARVRRDFE